MNFKAKQAAKDEEKEMLANMTVEERMERDKADAGDMMAKIRAKQEALAKKNQEMAESGEVEEGDEARMAAKIEKEKKKNKKKEKRSGD